MSMLHDTVHRPFQTLRNMIASVYHDFLFVDLTDNYQVFVLELDFLSAITFGEK